MPSYGSLEELTKPMSAEECKAWIYAHMLAAGEDANNWEPGAVTRTIIAVVSIFFAAFSSLISSLAKMMFISSAEDSWLDVNGEGHWGEKRIRATFAGTTVSITNNSGSTVTLAKDAFLATNTRTGKQYRNKLGPVTIAFGGTQPLYVESVKSGAEASALPGEITIVSSGQLGLTVTNAVAALSRDDQTDQEYRDYLAQISSLDGNSDAKGAYDRALQDAVNFVDGAPLGINRVRCAPNGNFVDMPIYVATSTGTPLTGTSTNGNTQLGSATEVANTICPLGMSVLVANATVKYFTFSFTLTCTVSLPSTFSAEVELEIARVLASTKIGGYPARRSSSYWMPSALINDAPLVVAEKLGIRDTIKRIQVIPYATTLLPYEYPALDPGASVPVLIQQELTR
jgi:hypothetical protein